MSHDRWTEREEYLVDPVSSNCTFGSSGFYQTTPYIATIATSPFKFNEDKLITEALDYIRKTYGEHYSKEDGIQSIELIFSRKGRGENFAISNILKLADRYGYKDGKNRKDLLKIIHYAVLTLYLLDKENTGS